MHAVDRWVRLGRRSGLLELTVVLSMQVLGGDPQAAYLLGLASIGYAMGLAWHRAMSLRSEAAAAAKPSGLANMTWLAMAAVVVWSFGGPSHWCWLSGYPNFESRVGQSRRLLDALGATRCARQSGRIALGVAFTGYGAVGG